MGELAARNGGWAGLATLTAILLLGLGLRVDYAWESRAPVFDAVAYSRIAANLDRGDGFTAGSSATQPSSDYSPGLPLLVAGVYKISGGVHERLARVVLALIGAFAVLFTYLIGRRLSGLLAGLIGAAAVAVYPALLEYQGMLMGEPLAATLLSGAVLSMLWASDFRASDARRSGARWLLPGVLLGGLALVRPEYLAVAFLLALLVLARKFRDDWKRSAASTALLLLGMVIVVAPWTIRNAIALDRFVPISTGGGQVLFAGTYIPSGGDPERVGREVLERHPGLTRRLADRGDLVPHSDTNSPQLLENAVLARVRLEQILAGLAAQRYPEMETDQALARMGRKQLWDDITEQPLDYAGFVAAKVGRVWSHGPRDVMRKPLWEAFHWALLAFGLLGFAVLARQRRWEALLLATLFISITVICALLVASPRRVLVMLPLVAALAGVGASWLSKAIDDFSPP